MIKENDIVKIAKDEEKKYRIGEVSEDGKCTLLDTSGNVFGVLDSSLLVKVRDIQWSFGENLYYDDFGEITEDQLPKQLQEIYKNWFDSDYSMYLFERNEKYGMACEFYWFDEDAKFDFGRGMKIGRAVTKIEDMVKNTMKFPVEVDTKYLSDDGGIFILRIFIPYDGVSTDDFVMIRDRFYHVCRTV